MVVQKLIGTALLTNFNIVGRRVGECVYQRGKLRLLPPY